MKNLNKLCLAILFVFIALFESGATAQRTQVVQDRVDNALIAEAE